MICVSVMLAILQIWPMMFGHDANQAIAAEPLRPIPPTRGAARNVVILPVPQPADGQSRAVIPAMQSCLGLYREALNECRRGDANCTLTASDRWQVCEATGF
jgi:hypothetical protein